MIWKLLISLVVMPLGRCIVFHAIRLRTDEHSSPSLENPLPLIFLMAELNRNKIHTFYLVGSTISSSINVIKLKRNYAAKRPNMQISLTNPSDA